MDGYRQAELVKIKNEVMELQMGLNRRYLHLRSVDNFIFHFDEIENEADKEWIYTTLTNYLLFCKQIDEDIDTKMGNQLYYEFLDKVAQYYRYHLKFRMVVNKVSYGIMFLVLLLTIVLVFNFLVSLIVVPVFVHFLIYINNKRKQKKVYGVFY